MHATEQVAYELPLDPHPPLTRLAAAVRATASAAHDAHDLSELLAALGLLSWARSDEGRAAVTRHEGDSVAVVTQLDPVAEARRCGRDDAEAALLPHYSRALDEVYRLRQALAYESHLLEQHLAVPAFRPKGVRTVMERQIRRMTWASQGGALAAYEVVSPQEMRDAMHEAGMVAGLTRDEWENPLFVEN